MPAAGPARGPDPPRRRVLPPASYPQRQTDPHQVTREAPARRPRLPGTPANRPSRPPAAARGPQREPAMRPSFTLFLSIGAILSGAASAQNAPATEPAEEPAEFDRVVVTATRTARAIADVPNTVDVIGRERMDELLVRDLKDLFHFEPGVTVTGSYGRFGIRDIRIRGLGGNRVRILTDGVPVSDAFEIGNFSNANRNFVDLDPLKRVEVVRGPSSALYGSDALGGVVAFVTRDPADYLAPGEDAHLGFKLGAESDWDGLFAGATAALGGERWSGLL